MAEPGGLADGRITRMKRNDFGHPQHIVFIESADLFKIERILIPEYHPRSFAISGVDLHWHIALQGNRPIVTACRLSS